MYYGVRCAWTGWAIHWMGREVDLGQKMRPTKVTNFYSTTYSK